MNTKVTPVVGVRLRAL